MFKVRSKLSKGKHIGRTVSKIGLCFLVRKHEQKNIRDETENKENIKVKDGICMENVGV